MRGTGFVIFVVSPANTLAGFVVPAQAGIGMAVLYKEIIFVINPLYRYICILENNYKGKFT